MVYENLRRYAAYLEDQFLSLGGTLLESQPGTLACPDQELAILVAELESDIRWVRIQSQ